MFLLALSEFHYSVTKNRQRIAYLLFAGAAIFTRLNALIYYLPLAIFHLYFIENRKQLLRRQAILTIVCGLLFLLYDFCFFGELILTPWNFLKRNVFDGVARNYGMLPFGWYASKGLLSIGVLYYPIGIFGLLSLRNDRFVFISKSFGTKT